MQSAIATIKEQGEGTSTSPDAPQFGGELAHYYRFGEIFHGRKLIEVDGHWEYAGDEIPFPDCYPVKQVPPEGYPGSEPVQKFDETYGTLILQLQAAWRSGQLDELSTAVGTMFTLASQAQAIVTQPLSDGSGNYGPNSGGPRRQRRCRCELRQGHPSLKRARQNYLEEEPMSEMSLKPALVQPGGFRFGEVSSFTAFRALVSSVPSLGPLAAFTGTFTGNGFNTIFRPDSPPRRRRCRSRSPAATTCWS